MSEQKNELRQIITDALVSMVSGVTGLVPPSGPGAIPDFIQAPIDRAVEKIAAILPVGVPDGWKLVPISATRDQKNSVCMHPDLAAVLYSNMVKAAPAAPTVKAEQVDDRAECIADGLSVGMSQEEAEEFADKIAAPSLPAAGSELTASQCACGDEYPANSYGAGFMAANNGICENCDAANRCADGSMTAAGSAVDRVVATAPERIYLIIGDGCPRDVDFSELGEVAWCEEEAAQGIEYVRAALSAQQSAPELVSVPVELAQRIVTWREGDAGDSGRAELRALLASHAEGGKV